MARLVTLLAQTGLFFPVPDIIMHDRSDPEKPGIFLQLFPNLLSRLYLTLLWKISQEQDGDAVVLSNVWLRDFAMIDNKSFLKYRKYLNDHKLIVAAPLDSGREFLYRCCNPTTGLPLSDETNLQAVARLRNPERIQWVARARVMRKYRIKSPDIEEQGIEPNSGWNGW